MGHSLLLLWGPEAQGDFVRWVQNGGPLAIRGGCTAAFCADRFMLASVRMIARLVAYIRPNNAIALSGPIAVS